MPNELAIDAVGLWQIIPYGRHDFGFNGQDLEAFTAEALSNLLARGAVPITGQDGKWVIEHRYGTANQEIITNVIDKWLAPGAPDPDVESVWFGLPSVVLD
ncbi:hypothetical protein [Mesorhizobium sp. SP-1A]|uniref:hypothetical protein n=1 Tax=Mesorhizobium sp. SP-1A TaxID=3077840 RepID=UPI0028F6C3D2|nr:hypothetical protein [Mesorhizobium sp. SP-1A]